jgi:hypothetical protein
MKTKATLSELIERYLDKSLSPEELTAFESRLQQDPALKMEIQTQQILMKGIDRVARKQIVRHDFRRYRMIRKIMFVAGLLLLIASVFAVIYVKQQPHKAPKEVKQRATALDLPAAQVPDPGKVVFVSAPPNQAAHLPPVITPGQTASAPQMRIIASDEFLPVNKYLLDSRQERVLSTPGGLLFAIPSNAFVNEKGELYTGNVNISIQEALDPATIIKGGLSTFTGNKWLETAGMFNVVAADSKYKQLRMAPGKSITARIPYEDYKADMKLYDGERLADASVNWVNPQPLENYLVSVEMSSLDFYPPRYINALSNLGYKVQDKVFTDSLYYSFVYKNASSDAGRNSPPDGMNSPAGQSAGPIAMADSAVSTSQLYRTSKPVKNKRKPIQQSVLVAAPVKSEGINPAKIKAIWNTHFENTLLSTKEFEERMVWIHSSCNEQLLDLYVKNLNLQMWEIDSMAMQLSASSNYISEAFRAFYKRHDGSVKNPNVNARMLNEYYLRQTLGFSDQVKKTLAEFWAKQRDLDRESFRKAIENSEKEAKRITNNFREELNLNMHSTYVQLGIKTGAAGSAGSSPFIRSRTTHAYTAKVTTLGWKNIDRLVNEATVSRTTLDYTDPHSGKKVLIRYDNLYVEVQGDYQLIKVCLLPDQLSSYMNMPATGKGYAEKLNSQISYTLVATGFKEDGIFYQVIPHVKPGVQHISLSRGTEAELNTALKQHGKGWANVAQLEEEVAYQKYILYDDARKSKMAAIHDLTKRIRWLVLPCAAKESEPVPRARVCMLEGIKDSSQVSVSDLIKFPQIFICDAGDYREILSYDLEINWGGDYKWAAERTRALTDKQLSLFTKDAINVQGAYLIIRNMKFRKMDKSLGTAKDLYLKLLPETSK